MSAEMQTKVQASPTQSFTYVQTGLLQKQSALCNTPGLVEDSGRDKDKLTLQRSSVEPRFGHDFSRLSVHSTGQGIIQTKLKINKPRDLYEQEADRVTEHVMMMPGKEFVVLPLPSIDKAESSGLKAISHNIPPLLQRQETKGKQKTDDEKYKKEVIAKKQGKRKRLRTPMPDPKKMGATERKLYDKFVRSCTNIRILQRLNRWPHIPPSEKIRLLKDRLRFIGIYFNLKKVKDQNNRKAYQCVVECIFGKGYVLLSEKAELARTQCEINKAQWQAFALDLYGQIPGERGIGVPSIPEPRTCMNPDRLDLYLKRVKAGKGCENGKKRTHEGEL